MRALFANWIAIAINSRLQPSACPPPACLVVPALTRQLSRSRGKFVASSSSLLPLPHAAAAGTGAPNKDPEDPAPAPRQTLDLPTLIGPGQRRSPRPRILACGGELPFHCVHTYLVYYVPYRFDNLEAKFALARIKNLPPSTDKQAPVASMGCDGKSIWPPGPVAPPRRHPMPRCGTLHMV